MSVPFPLTDHVRAPWYPGSSLPLPGAFFAEPLLPFTPEDERRFWVIEGHWSRGMTPLCVSTASDVLWGTQYGANLYQLPATRGQSARMTGAHAYLTDLPCCSEWEVIERSGRVERLVGPAIVNFAQLWADRRDSLISALRHLESADLAALDLAGVSVYLKEAWAFHRWAWEVHFELMDPLIGNYFAFKGACAALGIPEADVVRFFQGSDSKIMETDRALWHLAAVAAGTDVEQILASRSGDDALAALRASAVPAIAAWIAELEQFLQTYGWRTEGMCDPALAPWIEDSTPVLALVVSFMRADAHDFAAARNAAIADRDDAIATTRSRLDEVKRAAFDAALAMGQGADFSWWQEEHNFYIDLRAHIPIRRAALRLAELLGADQREDLIFLFRHELDDLAGGRQSLDDFRSIITERRAFYEASSAQRSQMPAVLGTPAVTDDPVMSQIFGVDQRLLESVSSLTAETTVLRGVPASGGKVLGVARVIVEATRLGEIQPDEILVCSFTSPNWTPAFALIAGCVCDTGGVLSHTAIVSREYRVPAVCGTGAATALIRTGDTIEVDGTTGTVRIVERAR